MTRAAVALGLAVILCALLGAGTWASTTFDSSLPPPPPMALYGAAKIYGRPAPVGTVVEARGTGVKVGIIGNPITTTATGQYGGPAWYEVKLGVQGWIDDGAPIRLYLNGEQAQVSVDGVTWGSSLQFRAGVVSKVQVRALKRIIMLFVQGD